MFDDIFKQFTLLACLSARGSEVGVGYENVNVAALLFSTSVTTAYRGYVFIVEIRDRLFQECFYPPNLVSGDFLLEIIKVSVNLTMCNYNLSKTEAIDGTTRSVLQTDLLMMGQFILIFS